MNTVKIKYHYGSKVPLIPPESTAKIGFIHMPKTGGTFFYAWTRMLSGQIMYFTHNPARMVTGYNLPLFGLVRNPFDWYVSRYFYFRRCDAVERGVSKSCDAGLPAGDFAKRFPTFRDHLIWGFDSNLPNFTFTQMYTKMFTLNGKSLMYAIGKIENMATWVRMICAKHDIRPEITFDDYANNADNQMYRNKSDHTHYSDYYDIDMENAVLKQDGVLMSFYNYKMER